MKCKIYGHPTSRLFKNSRIKNKNIIKFEDNKNNREYAQILEIIFDNIDYKNILRKDNYLNH